MGIQRVGSHSDAAPSATAVRGREELLHRPTEPLAPPLVRPVEHVLVGDGVDCRVDLTLLHSLQTLLSHQ